MKDQGGLAVRKWYEKKVPRILGLLASVGLIGLNAWSLIDGYLLSRPYQLALFCGGMFSAILAFVQNWASVNQRGKRLKEEISFKMESLKHAFELLSDFRADIRDDHDAGTINKKGSRAVSRMLEIISNDMFYPRTAYISWWLPSPDNPTTLIIDDRWPQDDNTDMSLSIDLAKQCDGTYEPKDGQGVAGFSYGKGTTYYLPDTRRCRYRTLYPSSDGKIKAVSSSGRIWKDSERTPSLRSLLSVPIVEPPAVHGGESAMLGVLCVGSDSVRAFRDEDIWFAWIAGRMLREQLVVTRDHETED